LFKANKIVIAENLYASAFSDIAKSKALLKRRFQLLTSPRSTILSSARVMNNLPFESAGLAGARRMDPLQNVPSQASITKQERRRAYRRKSSARLKSLPFKCASPPAVEPQSIVSPSSGFTYCQSATSGSDLTDNFLFTCSKEGGVTDLNDTIDSVTVTCDKSPSSLRSDSITFICKKIEVTSSALPITAST